MITWNPHEHVGMHVLQHKDRKKTGKLFKRKKSECAIRDALSYQCALSDSVLPVSSTSSGK